MTIEENIKKGLNVILANMLDTNSLVSYHLAGGNYREGKIKLLCAPLAGSALRSLADFVGCVVGFLNVFVNTPAEPPSCRLVIL